MMKTSRRTRVLFLTLFAVCACGAVAKRNSAAQQASIPPLPEDLRVIHFLDADGKLAPLPFEEATSNVAVEWDKEAGRDAVGHVALKGEHAPTVVRPDTRFYLFVLVRGEAPPPFLVRLKQKGGARRMTAIIEKGRRWFAPLAEETIVPRYRVLEEVGLKVPAGFVLPVHYMELSFTRPLPPGEYAFIGKGLLTTSTFRVAADDKHDAP